MIKSYAEGKDLYATMASQVYSNRYEENKEFWPDGTPNPEGKKRRANCKSLLLGLMYGRGVASIADQLHCDIKEAQKISDDFYRGFPRIKEWMEESQKFAKEHGYVEDLWGRRRRLPDIQKPPYEVKSNTTQFNPLLDTKGIISNPKDNASKEYLERLKSCRNYKQKENIKYEAAQKGITIKDNGGFIAQAERQCVNARIQGSAATESKKAMISIHNDERLKELGFKLMLAVHDEVIGECPIENQEEVAERLSQLMIDAVKPECDVPMKCDSTVTNRWYIDDYSATIHEQYKSLSEKLNDPVLACNQLIRENSFINPTILKEMMETETFNCIKYEKITC